MNGSTWPFALSPTALLKSLLSLLLVVLLNLAAWASGDVDGGGVAGNASARAVLLVDLENIRSVQDLETSNPPRGNLFLSEAIVRVAKRLLKNDDVLVFSAHDLFEAMTVDFKAGLESDRHGPRSIAELVRSGETPAFYLRAIVEGPNRRKEHTLRLWLDSVDGDLKRAVSFKFKGDLQGNAVVSTVIDLLQRKELLHEDTESQKALYSFKVGDARIAERVKAWGLVDYATPSAFDHHERIAKATLYRLLGDRLGEPIERQMVEFSRTVLGSVPDPAAAHLNAAIEYAEGLYQLFQLSPEHEKDRRLLEDALSCLHGFSGQAKESAHYHYAEGLIAYWLKRPTALPSERKEALVQAKMTLGKKMHDAIAIDSRFARAHYQRGYSGLDEQALSGTESKEERERLEEANRQANLAHFDRAAGLNPAFLQARTMAAWMRISGNQQEDRRQEDKRLAETEFQVLGSEGYRFPNAIYFESRWALGQDRPAEAIRILTELEKTGFYKQDAQALLALAHIVGGHYKEAEIAAVRALAGDDETIASVYESGLDAMDAGNPGHAGSQFAEVRKLVSSRVERRGWVDQNDGVLLGLSAARSTNGAPEAREIVENLRILYRGELHTRTRAGVAVIYWLLNEQGLADRLGRKWATSVGG